VRRWWMEPGYSPEHGSADSESLKFLIPVFCDFASATLIRSTSVLILSPLELLADLIHSVHIQLHGHWIAEALTGCKLVRCVHSSPSDLLEMCRKQFLGHKLLFPEIRRGFDRSVRPIASDTDSTRFHEVQS
jgi:hypothetical protein